MRTRQNAPKKKEKNKTQITKEEENKDIIPLCGKCMKPKEGEDPCKCGRPRLWNSPEELQKQADEYFATCLTQKKPISITGLCIHLGTIRQTLINYQNKGEFLDTVNNIKQRVENYLEERALLGETPAKIATFMLNNYGWKNESSVNVTSKNQSVNLNMDFEAKNEDEAKKKLYDFLNSNRTKTGK